MSDFADKCPQGWEASELLALVEGDRTEDTDALELHVRECEVCARELGLLRNMIATLRENPESFHPDRDELFLYATNRDQTDEETCAHIESCEECGRDIEILKEMLSVVPEPSLERAAMPDSLARAVERELGTTTRAGQVRPSWTRRCLDWLSSGFYPPMLTLGTAVAVLVVAILLIPMWPTIKDASKGLQNTVAKGRAPTPPAKSRPSSIVEGAQPQSVVAKPLEKTAQDAAGGRQSGFQDAHEKEPPASLDESTTLESEKRLGTAVGDSWSGGLTRKEEFKERVPPEVRNASPSPISKAKKKAPGRAFVAPSYAKPEAQPAPITPLPQEALKAPGLMSLPRSAGENGVAKEKDSEQEARPPSDLKYGFTPGKSPHSPSLSVREPRGAIAPHPRPTREEAVPERRSSAGSRDIAASGERVAKRSQILSQADKLEEPPAGPVFGKAHTGPSVEVSVVDHIGRPIPWLKYSPTEAAARNRRFFPQTVSAGQNLDWIRRQFRRLKKPIKIIVRVFGYENNYTLTGEVIDPKTSRRIHEAQIGDELSKDELQDALNDLVDYLSGLGSSQDVRRQR